MRERRQELGLVHLYMGGRGAVRCGAAWRLGRVACGRRALGRRADLLALAEGLGGEGRELVEAGARLEELALRVEDPRVAHLVLEAELAVRLLRHEQRRAVDEGLGAHRVVVLQVEHRDLDVLLHLVPVGARHVARVERDRREHLRRRRPLLLALVHVGERLAHVRHLLLERDGAVGDAAERELADLLQLRRRQLLQPDRELLQHLPREHERHVLGEQVLEEALEVRDVLLREQVLEHRLVPLDLRLLVRDRRELGERGGEVHGEAEQERERGAAVSADATAARPRV